MKLLAGELGEGDEVVVDHGKDGLIFRVAG